MVRQLPIVARPGVRETHTSAPLIVQSSSSCKAPSPYGTYSRKECEPYGINSAASKIVSRPRQPRPGIVPCLGNHRSVLQLSPNREIVPRPATARLKGLCTLQPQGANIGRRVPCAYWPPNSLGAGSMLRRPTTTDSAGSWPSYGTIPQLPKAMSQAHSYLVVWKISLEDCGII